MAQAWTRPTVKALQKRKAEEAKKKEPPVDHISVAYTSLTSDIASLRKAASSDVFSDCQKRLSDLVSNLPSNPSDYRFHLQLKGLPQILEKFEHENRIRGKAAVTNAVQDCKRAHSRYKTTYSAAKMKSYVDTLTSSTNLEALLKDMKEKLDTACNRIYYGEFIHPSFLKVFVDTTKKLQDLYVLFDIDPKILYPELKKCEDICRKNGSRFFDKTSINKQSDDNDDLDTASVT